MLWMKAFHIIFVVTWFAGLFYLPRLFVYHASTDDSIGSERFQLMERRLFVMMTIGGIGSLLSGASLALYWPQPWPGWLLAKLVLVGLLVAYHLLCWIHLRAFAQRRNQRSGVYFRMINEVPTLILVATVLLVVLKPT